MPLSLSLSLSHTHTHTHTHTLSLSLSLPNTHKHTLPIFLETIFVDVDNIAADVKPSSEILILYDVQRSELFIRMSPVQIPTLTLHNGQHN